MMMTCGVTMVRRCAALLLLGLLSACTTVEDLAPVSATGSASAVGYPRFGDSDPHQWTRKTPWHYAVHGTDVSKYQRSIDWPTAKSKGISFAFIKATEGGDRVDGYFNEHWAMTRAANMPRAAYHFYYFCRPAAEQAAWYINNVPKEAGSLPPVLDMEWNPQSPTCKLRPSPSTVRSEMLIFLRIVEKHYGKKPIIYTSVDFFDDNNLSTFKGYPYWLRSVAGHPEEKYGSHPWTFWQYTGTGKVPGITGDADINVFNGTKASFNAWLKQNAH